MTETWMDGKQETCPCGVVDAAGGELRLSSARQSTMAAQVKNERAIPLANARIHAASRVEA